MRAPADRVARGHASRRARLDLLLPARGVARPACRGGAHRDRCRARRARGARAGRGTRHRGMRVGAGRATCARARGSGDSSRPSCCDELRRGWHSRARSRRTGPTARSREESPAGRRPRARSRARCARAPFARRAPHVAPPMRCGRHSARARRRCHQQRRLAAAVLADDADDSRRRRRRGRRLNDGAAAAPHTRCHARRHADLGHAAIAPSRARRTRRAVMRAAAADRAAAIRPADARATRARRRRSRCAIDRTTRAAAGTARDVTGRVAESDRMDDRARRRAPSADASATGATSVMPAVIDHAPIAISIATT